VQAAQYQNPVISTNILYADATLNLRESAYFKYPLQKAWYFEVDTKIWFYR
jgi:hypothetical protein